MADIGAGAGAGGGNPAAHAHSDDDYQSNNDTDDETASDIDAHDAESASGDEEGGGGGGSGDEEDEPVVTGWTQDVKPHAKTFHPCTVKATGKKPLPGQRVCRLAAVGAYCDAYLSEDLLEHVVHQTNLYAAQTDGPHRKTRWETLTVNRLKRWIAIAKYMGIVKLPNRRMYWQGGITSTGWCNTVMSEPEWEQIRSMLHFADNANQPPKTDPGPKRKVYKVDTLFTLFNDIVKRYYTIGPEASVDEQTIRSKHRSPLQQYNPNKPAKRHLKVWAICGAKDGYVWHCSLYGGKADKTAKADDEDTGLGERVVLHMQESLPGEWHELFFDNFFTSPELIQKLEERKTYGTGTCRTNRRDFPSDFALQEKKTSKKSQHKRGVMSFASKDDLVMFSVKDTKVVNLLTNRYAADDTETIKRRVKSTDKDGKTRITKDPFPSCSALVQYNKFMGGVDQADYYRKIYGTDLKSRKWTLAVWDYIVNSLSANAWLRAKLDNIKISHLQFELDMIMHLASAPVEPAAKKAKAMPAGKVCKQGKKSMAQLRQRALDSRDHYPLLAGKEVPCKNCKWFGSEVRGCEAGTRAETLYRCDICEVALHPECMREYHKHMRQE